MPLDEFDDRRVAPGSRDDASDHGNWRSKASSLAEAIVDNFAGFGWAFAALAAVILGVVLC